MSLYYLLLNIYIDFFFCYLKVHLWTVLVQRWYSCIQLSKKQGSQRNNKHTFFLVFFFFVNTISAQFSPTEFCLFLWTPCRYLWIGTFSFKCFLVLAFTFLLYWSLYSIHPNLVNTKIFLADFFFMEISLMTLQARADKNS